MTEKTRLRFAPSPTGPLHIGGLRTALFNYLYAKKTNGELVLRIEDTDLARKVDKSQEHIEQSLAWAGINFDESSSKGGQSGPYNQSERREIYKEYVEKLIETGWAYYAFDKKEKLDFHRADHEKRGKKFIYNAHNRLKLDNSLSMSDEEIKKRIDKERFVIRFKTPDQQEVGFKDIIRGEMVVSTRDIDDKILLKSDGMPTYHLANVVDDYKMGITHVIRGEEWLPSLALHVLLYRAFGWNEPIFAHLPLILKPTGKGKLSKRDGDKFGFPVYAKNWKDEKIYAGFDESGFLPEALVNYMAFLGWSPKDDKEIYSMNELISDFSLEKINKGGAKFDPAKLLWINSQHIQALDLKDLVKICSNKNQEIPKEKFHDFIKLIQPRMDRVVGLKNKFYYLFDAPEINEEACQKMINDEIKKSINSFIVMLKEKETNDSSEIKSLIQDSAEKNSAKLGKVMAFCRLSIVGKMEGPDVSQMMAFIGFEETVCRLKKALS